ncbi:MAG: amino acid adenylation domain-containing protein, partial [Gemmatimonadota bacterium]
APPIERVPRTGPLPLSFAQQRLWLMDRIEPGSPAYNMHFALRLRGALDADALRASLDALVERHETLRTTFEERAGVPVQVVHPPAPAALPVLDLRGAPDAEARARRLAAEEALLPFDLERGPLLRARLLRLGEDDHVLCLTLHHVVSDGLSMQVLVREVSALYTAFSRGEEPRLPELPVQYADFAVWQREWLSGETLEAQVEFWRGELAGAPALLEIPLDRPRAPGQSPLAANHAFRLSPELSRALRALSRREGTTLFITLLAGWQALLARYSGQEDLVVGTPIAGRSRVEVEGLIGFFVNMLPLRADLSGDPTWTELLGRVRETALGAYDHQELPFDRMVEELAVERDLTHTPVFQTSFTLESSGARDPRLELGELTLEPVGRGERAAQFDLDLSVFDRGDGLVVGMMYREALFDAATMERMGRHLEAALEAMAADPRLRLSGVSLLRGAERAQVLEEWNATAADFPRSACVHDLFAAQAARTPHAPAVVFEEVVLSYAELDAAAGRMAGALRARGVVPETRVAICVPRGPGMAVAILGALRAGGAYVPLDPDYPSERLAWTMADSGARVLVTTGALAGALPDFGGEVVRVDGDLAPADGVEHGPAPTPDNLAYVIYTSGSTGRPKGAMVQHRAVVGYAVDFAARMGLGAGDRVLQFASPGFDVVVEELFPAWASGAAVVFSRGNLLSPAELLATIERHGVTAFELPTAYWHEWVRELARDGRRLPASVRLVIVGGERVLPERLAEWALLDTPLVHVFGLTETACTSTTLRLEAGDDGSRWSNLPVGRPTGNVRLYVLDPSLQPVPPGVAGELWIAGEGVGRGYHASPGPTAERFVPDPFGPVGARAYRTGDRVRWLAGGELEFLGRLDQQVKIRGFRIEPAEVEAALVELGPVREAAVLVREDVPGQKRLVAYLVPEEGADGAAAGVRERLRTRLPEHMVPSAYVLLERLPLSASGKVDRWALPAPEQEGAAHLAPRPPPEEVLGGIWGEVLRLETVGVEESFFELGGHSLLAMQVVSRVRQAFGVEVPLRALFEAQTVAGLAARVEALRGAGTALAPPIERVSRTEPPPLSFAQQRLWVVDRLEPGNAAYNMPFALRLRGRLDVEALRSGLDALVEHHETLRTTFAEQGGAPVQVIHPPAPVALPVLDLRDAPDAEAEAERLAFEDAIRPFDLTRGPLLRCTLLRLAGDDHVLCFTLHHVVGDGWSMQVLVREVSALYAAFVRGEEPRLPELPVQYADFAVWQRAWLSGERLEAQIGFWKTRLSGAPPLLEIPTDRPRGTGSTPHAARQPLHVPPETSRALRALSRREGTTLFMTLLAAWQALLGRYAGQDDVVVGSAVAGRNRHEVEGLIGFFVNMLPLRADLSGDPTWTELLGRVRETALAAYDHQDLPFERLVEELAVERSLVHSPVFQVIFSLNRADAREERLSLDEV